MKSEEQRIHSLDGLRGIACVVVFLFHLGCMLLPFGPLEVAGVSIYELMPGKSSVLVFYVLSGVVLSIVPLRLLDQKRSYDWFAYFPRRIVRLCIPLVAAILLGVAAGFIAFHMGSGTRSAQAVDYAADLPSVVHDILMQFDVLFYVSDGWYDLFGGLLHRVDSPVWSMSWEMWFSLCLPLVVYAVWRIKRLPLAFIACGICVFVSYWSNYFPLRLCIMFVFGTLLAREFSTLSRLKPPVWLEALALIAALALIEWPIVCSSQVLIPLAKTLMSLACVLLVLLAMVDGFVRRALSVRPCRWLGKISYSMYLTHIILIAGFREVLPLIGITSPLVHAGLSVVCCFAFAWLFWRLVERPSIDLSHKVKRTIDSEMALESE